MKRVATLVCILLAAAGTAVGQQPRAVDAERSRMTVRVFRGGLFGFAGHNHEIRAPIASGTVDEATGKVEIRVDARQLLVLDPDVDAKERQEVQETMHGPKVLDSGRYPEIRFHSTEAQKSGDEWLVRGELTLHGQSKPVEVRVKGGQGRYTGTASVKQKDFGMEPVSVAGGTIKVKNEVKVEFEIVLK
ncbi:MAG TPA: YceI family protein [Terriglobales bacterium]|nr:YceI family protein [Terriglobales bacterium]